MCLTFMKIIFKESVYKILNVDFTIIRTHFIFCTYFLFDVLAILLFTAVSQIFKLREI